MLRITRSFPLLFSLLLLSACGGKDNASDSSTQVRPGRVSADLRNRWWRFAGEVNTSGTLNFALIASSYQNSYGNLYTNPTDIFEAQYAANIGSLLPSTTPITTLYSNGQLPQDVLFSSIPPAPEFAAETPATQPAALAPIFAMGFGSPDLVTNTYRLAMQNYWTANTGAAVSVLDVDSAVTAGDPYDDLKKGFAAAKALLAANAVLGGATDGGATAVLEAYHARLVPPVCLSAVKSFFDGF
jgi:hypothetical protein